MSGNLIIFEENDPLKASTTNANNNFLLEKITETAQVIENEIDALELSLETLIDSAAAPIGSVIMWTSSDIPENWLAMVGQDITNEAYADLRTVIGATSLPDTRAKVAQGTAESQSPLSVIAAGLPNITGYAGGNINGSGGSGALYVSYTSEWGSMGTQSGGNTIVIDASRSSSIYGASDTVQPPAFTVVFIIKYK